MGKPVRKRWVRRGLVAVSGLTLLLVLTLGIVWWRLPDVLNFAVRRTMPELGLEGVSVDFEVADARNMRLRAEADVPGLRIGLRDLEARYTLRGLWNQRRAELLILDGLHLVVDVATIEEQGIPFIPESDEPFDPFDLSWLEVLPAERIEVRDALVRLRLPDREIVFEWATTLTSRSHDSAEVGFKLLHEDLEAHLRAILRDGGSSHATFEATVQDPWAALERHLPEWREQTAVPDDLAVAVGTISLQGRVEVFPDQRMAGAVLLSLPVLSAQFGDGSTEVGELRIEVETDGVARDRVRVSAGRIDGQWDTLVVGAEEWNIDILTHDRARWEFSMAQPVMLRHGEMARAAVTLAATVDLDVENSAARFEARAGLADLQAAEFKLTPVTVQLSGDEKGGTLAIERVALQEAPETGIEGLAAVFRLSEGGAIEASLRATMGADALAYWADGLRHAPLELDLQAQGKGEEFGLKGVVLPTTADVWIELPSVGSVSGDFSTRVELSSVDSGDSLSGRWTVTGGGLRIEGDSWWAEGLDLDGGITLKDVPVDALGDTVAAEALFAVLAETVSAQIDWQANGIFADDGAAQWLSGHIRMGGDESRHPLEVILTASGGVLQLMEESLQQANLELRTWGNGPDRMELEGTASFWYSGNEALIEFDHRLDDLLGNPSLEGRYALRPLRFDYLDVIGRYVPDVLGLSFSGTFDAEGHYWLRDGEADASVLARMSGGSVDYPASQVTVEGLEARLALSSVTQLSGDEASEITIERVHAGDITAGRGAVRFQMIDAQTIMLIEAMQEVFGGRVRVDSAPLRLDPPEFAGTVRFERLSLLELTQQMSFFDGTMEGVISGQMPFAYRDGQLIPKEGLLQLPEGEQARLRYNAQGLLTGDPPDDLEKPGFMDRLTARVLKTLQLEPEKVVEDALSDLVISRLKVELFPEDARLTPVRVEFAGQAMAGNTVVPLHLKTNVNGTLDELYNFLIRLNSLGPSSF